jgi:hypothetical protein
MRKLAFALVIPALAAAVPVCAGPIEGVHVAVNRHLYRGTGCPVEIVFTASININDHHGPGLSYQYHWERSDGAKGPVHVIHSGPEGRTMVFHEKWILGKRGSIYDVSNTIHVGTGNERVSETSPTVHIECL